LKEVIPILEKYKEIELDKTVREKLSKISAATIDRVLALERKKRSLRQRTRTKPGTLLKHQIPIRTFCEWDEQRPGFVEIDLVGHEGGDPSGEYIQTLDMTDVCTGWTETQGVKNKARVWVFEAVKEIRKRLPFKLLGIDSDNGSEFINDHLYGYCEEEKITFTRARAYRKNDNCYVEQKNYSVVRRGVGYHRYDTPQQLRLLNQLYSRLRLYTNYFQPVMKLEEKIRVGSKVKKRYDQPRTPYHRVLESPMVEKEHKIKMTRLSPSDLFQQAFLCSVSPLFLSLTGLLIIFAFSSFGQDPPFLHLLFEPSYRTIYALIISNFNPGHKQPPSNLQKSMLQAKTLKSDCQVS
jgi:hypothetical protein